jgi:hypothetical protein
VRAIAAALALAVLALPGCGGSHDPGLTPEGAAALWSPWLGGYTMEGLPPQVLNGVKVRVGRGGQAGWVRVRVAPRGDRVHARVGRWVRLSDRPGTYRLPAPRVAYDYREVVIGLDQRDGGLALVHHEPCDPKIGEGADPCQIMALQIHRPVLPPEVRPVAADAEQVLPGRRLRAWGVGALDVDKDLVPDRTEDRTDPQVSARLVAVRPTSVVVAVDVANRGRRAADLPELLLSPSVGVGAGRWSGCVRRQAVSLAAVVKAGDRASRCALSALAAGARDTAMVTLPRVGPVTLRVRALAEGPDTHRADNTARLRLTQPLLAP